MKTTTLGDSALKVTPICLGTMTFGEQVEEKLAHHLLEVSFDLGINFIDTAEIYSVPTRAETFGATETILGRWLAKNPLKRQQLIIASKVAGPSRAMPWVRSGNGMNAQDILHSCHASLKRLQIETIDLYQIHWPTRSVPIFGAKYFDPSKGAQSTAEEPIIEQLSTLTRLVSEGKIRAIGLSNETPYGVHEFVRLAEKHGFAKIISVQNPYSLINRSFENGLDETCYRLRVGLLAYSPLGFGLLSGKYDASGLVGKNSPANARLTKYASMRAQRWGREQALLAARQYNALAREQNLTPAQMALAFCYQQWRVNSTIIGITDEAQLRENVAALSTSLAPELLAKIDALREANWDPAF